MGCSVDKMGCAVIDGDGFNFHLSLVKVLECKRVSGFTIGRIMNLSCVSILKVNNSQTSVSLFLLTNYLAHRSIPLYTSLVQREI